MDKTPKGKSLRFVQTISRNEESTVTPPSKTNGCTTSTPVKGTKKPRIWDNDICSQESGELEVKWDWNSPKNIKPKVLRRDKKESTQKSTEIVPKKSSQIDHIKNFEKLREELQALRNEIARVDDDCCLSPADEQTFREESAKDCIDMSSFNDLEDQYFHIEHEPENYDPPEIVPTKTVTVDDWHDDSCDEQLFICTQQLEEKLLSSKHIDNPNLGSVNENYENHYSKDFDKHRSITNILSPHNRGNKRSSFTNGGNSFDTNVQLRSADDSFDAVLKEFEDKDIDLLTQTSNNNNTLAPRRFHNTTQLNSSFKRTFSDANVQYVQKNNDLVKDSKVPCFQRTYSFESTSTSMKDNLPAHVMEEIERKKREALARLKKKKEIEKQQALNSEPYSDISPMKCSPDEIEQKRLQAKAIREAKQREIIEKNRQEALKRLEMNRLKRFGSVKNALVKKL